MTTEAVPPAVPPLTREQVENRLKYCPRLPSLSTINSALRELLGADQRYTSQVAEIIRRDPSLTARLLRLVNSVYYGLSTPVNNIEEAVFYLGVRQIRMPTDESDYVAGLIHDVGKIAMAAACPEHFEAVYHAHGSSRSAVLNPLQQERRVLGMDHSELGALYLRSHNLPDALVEVARYHHQPELSSHHTQLVAAVQIADLLVRHAGIGNSGNATPVTNEDWLNASGWSILFPERTDPEQAQSEKALAQTSLKRSLDRLPTILEGLV